MDIYYKMMNNLYNYIYKSFYNKNKRLKIKVIK